MFQETPPDSICVVRLSAIGDTCQALPVVRAVQDAWPETRVSWVIGKTEATLLADIPDVEFIIFDKSGGRDARRDLRRQLRSRRYDAALCMHASMRANLLYPSIRTPLRIGYDFRRARDFQWLFTNRRIPAVAGQHVQDAMMSFAGYLGLTRRTLRWDIPLSDPQREFAAGFRPDARPLLVISPCSSERARNFRNWSAENYAAAARHAMQKFGARVVVSGGGSDLEREYAATIRNLAGNDVADLVGQTSLKQLLALIEAADALLCPDSGPAHMATTVGTPVIGLYATSNPDRTGPYFSRDLVVNAYPEAVSRFLGKDVGALRWGQRVRDPGAMGLIRLAAVNERLDAVLGQQQNGKIDAVQGI